MATVADQAGVSWKHLGEFSERRTRLSLYKIAPGASLRLADNSIYFVSAGSGAVGAAHFGPHATIHVGPGEQGSVKASEPVEMLHLGLPCFS